LYHLQVLHQLEVLEANLSEALQQHQEEEQAAAAAAAAAVTTTAPSSAPPAAAPHVPGEGDAYVVVDDPLAPLAGSQLPLAGAFDPQLKAGAPPTVPSVAVMAGALPATSAAAAAAAAETTTAAAAALELQVQPGQHQGAPHVSPALEAAAFAELEAAAEAVTMGATGEWDESDVMTAAAAGAASSADTTPITTVSGTAAGDSGAIDSTKLWALFVLGLSYVHQATTGFALPALLPMISPSLHLDDFQGALLTSGYSYLYAAALVPVGLLADRVKRPQLLAVGLLLWSSLSIVASGARSFSDLLLTRIGFAAAQATQNPVSFSLIPDLFPANKSTALAGYNCAIYLGRALSFASVLAAHRLADSSAAAAGGLEGAPPGADIGLSMVPLDRLDLQRMSILYTTGDMAAVTPVYNYNFNVIAYEGAAALGGSDGWRELLTYIGYPGFVIAALMMLSVREPRDEKQQQEQAALASRSGSSSATASLATLSSSSSLSSMEEELAMAALAPSGGASSSSTAAATGPLEAWRQGATNLSQKLPLDVVNRLLRQGAIVARRTSAALRNATKGGSSSSSSSGAALAAPGSPPAAGVSSVQKLIRMPAFQTTTLAAALNDVGSYALIAWHSTFYERVYHLDSSVYAPMLAIILPVGGILGGLGGGLIGDYLSVVGGRQWLTAGEGRAVTNHPCPVACLGMLAASPVAGGPSAASLKISWLSTRQASSARTPHTVLLPTPMLPAACPVLLGLNWSHDCVPGAGASVMAAPFIMQSLLAENSSSSFLALLVGFALSEAWRAPSAIMIRNIAPQELGSTASALYLCIR
jgi:predicted MFS family arabinose efflux permease